MSGDKGEKVMGLGWGHRESGKSVYLSHFSATHFNVSGEDEGVSVDEG